MESDKKENTRSVNRPQKNTSPIIEIMAAENEHIMGKHDTYKEWENKNSYTQVK